ncbi:MAG: hypothetical protein A2X93_09865 [Deltaproteobacteria bacterium GWC2_56_8]|nr:MAG: hypothetical protein A2X99_10540 [Deltaproteobacteria bacterium GWB2_55_19]OGP33277.1 MAG: hypothetical protein A2X93_09865 [Deltaproteobacteria bacterium GWC2_56_8]HAO94329.1 hypothetical protein [Deltaproteobacteria bacterium]
MRQLKAVALSAFLSFFFITGTSFAELSERPWLGVVIEDPERGGAVLVSEVVPGGPADLAGVDPDDLIIGLNGEPISGTADLIKGIMEFKAGDKVALDVDSSGSIQKIDVTLEPMPIAMPERGRVHEHARHGRDKDAAPCAVKDHGCKDGNFNDGCEAHEMGVMEGANYGKMYIKLKAVGLDAVQTAKAREINADLRKKAARSGADIEVARIELRETLDAAIINLDRVKVKLVEIATKKADLSFLYIRAIEDIKKTLTPEQLSLFNGGESCPLDAHDEGD